MLVVPEQVVLELHRRGRNLYHVVLSVDDKGVHGSVVKKVRVAHDDGAIQANLSVSRPRVVGHGDAVHRMRTHLPGHELP